MADVGYKLLRYLYQGGIKGEGAVPTQSPTQAFLTRVSPNFQLPEHTHHHKS